MKKFLTYIWKYFLRTGGCRFYILLIPKVTFLLPKGQQKLTTFSDLVEEGLSYLQLFLELPDLIWGLRNVPISKKYAKNLRIHESCYMALADGMIYIMPSAKAMCSHSWIRRF